jgi:hypothetical protein
MTRRDWLCTVEFLPRDDPEARSFSAEIIGCLFWLRTSHEHAFAGSGLPEAKGTTVSHFATHPGEPGVFYAANNHGLFRSDDAGWSWKTMDLPWPGPGLADGVVALACLPE